MDSLNEKKHIPKLYITQPKVMEPSRTMQSHFHSTTKSKEKNESLLDREAEEKSAEKKKFKDMTLKEKVIYFANMPFHVPRIKCQVVTERKTYIGIIMDYQQDMVVMRVASRSEPVSIPFAQISEINQVGF